MTRSPPAVRRAVTAHLVAVVFAAFSLVVLIPNPGLWYHLPGAPTAYNIAMQYAGPLHIVLGALAAILYGRAHLGRREIAILAPVAIGISLGFELFGTGTGWPFGNYRYLDGLGYKVLGLVPYSIPLSWFYVAFAGYVLARHALARWVPRAPESAAIALGVWLLVSWDLVLDPAMAHEDLPLRFWVWAERGAYLGMPLVNLAGWIACGFAMLGVSRLLWGHTPDLAALPVLPMYAVYVGNLAFGAVICASLGLWAPIGLALVAGVLPASLALWGADQGPPPPATRPWISHRRG